MAIVAVTGATTEGRQSKMGNEYNIILCATENGRAVIFGSVSELPKVGEPVTLRNARMVLYWSAECGGLFGLAANGPKTTTRITAAVPSTVATTWKEYIECASEGAAKIAAWKSA